MDDETKQAAFGLAQIGIFLRSAQWRVGEDCGLTPTQIHILETLHRLGALRVRTIADRLGVAHPTASDAVGALESKGLIEKQADARDGRAVLISLTRPGREIAERDDAFPAGFLSAIGELGADNQAGLQRSLTSIIRSLQERGLIEPQRLCVTCRFFRPNAHAGAAKPHHCAFVDAAFGDARLRLDCRDHMEADDVGKLQNWRGFLGRQSA